ncbi:hypothetical protein ACE1N8_19180 [Streptomyces sp. DSM 116494]|uniref:hypothetical protein n=1 Tax=Streptomyces okerensis TaxID=3344655 RepID=UPI003890DE65
MPAISVKTCVAVGTGSLSAHFAGLSPLQTLATGAAVLVAAVLLKLLVLEWFSRKSDGVRSDVLKFACMLFLGQQSVPAESPESPEASVSRKRRRRRAK